MKASGWLPISMPTARSEVPHVAGCLGLHRPPVHPWHSGAGACQLASFSNLFSKY